MMSCVCVCVQVNQKQALGAMEEEQARRIKELSALSGDEIERRVAVSDKLVSVQRELLASRKPTKVRSHTQPLIQSHTHSHTHYLSHSVSLSLSSLLQGPLVTLRRY